MMNGKSRRPLGVARIFAGLVGHDDNARYALGGDLPRHLRHGKPAIVGLPARHRHRIVIQNFVSDVGVRGDRGADGKIAGMVVSAVAEILKNMRSV